MYELAGFIRFSQEVDKEDARRHWANPHGPMVAQIPGVTRYVQNDILEPLDIRSSGSVPFDGYLCQWYVSEDSLARAQASPEWAAVGSDAETFIGPSSMMGPIEERVVRSGIGSALKVVVVFEAGAAGDDAAAKLGKAATEVSGVSRYVENRRIDQPGWNLSYEAFAELWITNRDDIQPMLQALTVASPGTSRGGGVSWMAIVGERVVTG